MCLHKFYHDCLVELRIFFDDFFLLFLIDWHFGNVTHMNLHSSCVRVTSLDQHRLVLHLYRLLRGAKLIRYSQFLVLLIS